MSQDTPDVVVVGSGAGGAAAAWAFARRGVSVLLLEAGPAYDPSRDYLLDREDWELTRFPDKVAIAGRQTYAPMQKLEKRWDELRSNSAIRGRLNPSDRRASAGYSHVVGLGGSTLHFTGETQRLNAASMRMQTDFGVAADWPFAYGELEPWYDLAERITGVAGPAEDPRHKNRKPFPLPEHEQSYASRRLGEGFAALGNSWVANARAALSQPYDGRPQCNYCNNCNRGCPVTDKGSVDQTFIPKALATGNCEIRTDATVLEIQPGDDDRVKAVLYLDAGGRERLVRPRLVVLACGAVETPRLLLSSGGSPDGLGNESGEVGRNFMETLSWMSVGMHPDPLGSHRGLPAERICWDFNAPDAIPGVIGGCRFGDSVGEVDLTGPVNYALRAVPGFGGAHKAAMRAQFGNVLSLTSIGESLPHPKTFIDLDPKEKDENGQPKARIHSFMDDGEIKRLAFMAGKTREFLKAAGVSETFEEFGTYDFFNSTHVFGSCRMGADPETSVVDPEGRSHRWRNLIVADSSVFPSSGGGEGPALTIMALAIRSAEKAIQRGL